MVMFRGLADDLRLMDWLRSTSSRPKRRTCPPEFVRAGTRLAALEMIRSGTTTFVDMYYFEEEIAEATKEAGLRGVLGADDHRVPGRRTRRRRPRRWPSRALHQAFGRRSADRPAVAPHCAVHLRRRDAEGVRGAGRPLQRARPHPPGRDRRTRVKTSREQLPDARRSRSSSRSASAAEDARRARRLGHRDDMRDPEAAATSACRTMPAEQHEARLRRGAGRRPCCAEGMRARPRHGRRGQQQRPRHVRGDATRRRSSPSTRPAIRRRRPRRPCWRWRPWAARARWGWRTRSARWRPASARTSDRRLDGRGPP